MVIWLFKFCELKRNKVLSITLFAFHRNTNICLKRREGEQMTQIFIYECELSPKFCPCKNVYCESLWLELSIEYNCIQYNCKYLITSTLCIEHSCPVSYTHADSLGIVAKHTAGLVWFFPWFSCGYLTCAALWRMPQCPCMHRLEKQHEV